MGLATIARSTKRFEDLRAWCHHLVDDGAWPAALKAFGEAAEFVSGKHSLRGDFLDGAALAAQRLSREDLAAYLERAWQASPTMPRLCRWLGAANTKATLRKRVDAALATCPRQSSGQRALLLVLAYDFAAAANVLASAPGLGWSDDDHPGHLLFGLFAQLLAGTNQRARRVLETMSSRGAGHDDLEAMTADSERPRLATPTVDALLALAGVTSIPDASARTAVRAAMRAAAENRVAGVTREKRRRHYGHAAELVAICLACDDTHEARRWAAALHTEYRHFPALRAELTRASNAL